MKSTKIIFGFVFAVAMITSFSSCGHAYKKIEHDEFGRRTKAEQIAQGTAAMKHRVWNGTHGGHGLFDLLKNRLNALPDGETLKAKDITDLCKELSGSESKDKFSVREAYAVIKYLGGDLKKADYKFDTVENENKSKNALSQLFDISIENADMLIYGYY